MNEEQRKQQSQIKKDYSEYFTAPSLKSAKSRGKEDVRYHDDFTVSEELKGMGQGRKYYIRTYGCQMNEHDTEVMAGIFAQLGYEKTDDWREANVALLNTCAVRENAENKVFGEIGHLKSHKKNNPDFIIGLCGCMSQEESVVKFVMEKHPQVDFIFGTHNIHRLPEILKEAYMSKATVVEVWSKEGDIIESMPKIREGSIKAWVNIMYGCDKFCTYCIVPYTRGKERSRRPEDIIEEVRELAKAGYQEVTLLGQNVNAYGKDLDESMDLGDLLAEIKKIGIPRIRFTTSHPWDFTDNLIETIASGGNIMDYIHLPVQSGSSQILKLMGRNYTRESYLELVGKIKAAIPEVALTTDIIVGFPNETDEQFEETLTLYKEVEYDIAYTFIYSPREGTPAAKMEDNIPMEVKKERLKRLNVVVNEIALKKNQAFEGRIEKVLVEGTSAKDDQMLAGYTSKQKLVNFKGSEDFIGKIVDVKITKAKTWSLDGEMV